MMPILLALDLRENVYFRYEPLSKVWETLKETVRENDTLSKHLGGNTYLYIGHSFHDTVVGKSGARAKNLTGALFLTWGSVITCCGGGVCFLGFSQGDPSLVLKGFSCMALGMLPSCLGGYLLLSPVKTSYVVSVRVEEVNGQKYLRIETDHNTSRLFLAGRLLKDWTIFRLEHGIKKIRLSYTTALTDEENLIKGMGRGQWMIPLPLKAGEIYKLYTPDATYEITYTDGKIVILKTTGNFQTATF